MRKKQATLERARGGSSIATPGGATMFIPAGQLQSLFAQTFYGSKVNVPTQDATMFSPGTPLATQPGVNKSGYPIAYKFPIAYNSFPIDRTQGNSEIPSFAQLRSLAKLSSAIGLCERAWFDMVPRMKLKIGLTKAAIAAGAEEKNYQKEIAFFTRFFEKPDKKRDLHTWLRRGLREQTQIDELYIFKRRTRGGDLYGLDIIAGDTMKPLLDDWGDIPTPDSPDPFAYQQYPWGIPGAKFTTEQMIHYNESPAADTPFGQSRIERVIMDVNLALRKKRKDLARYTEGNMPAGLMKVPAELNWTPDQIDSYEQMWNALISGNVSGQVKVKFTQPGMDYVKFDEVGVDVEFEQYLLNIAVASYGLSLQDLAFTGDIHKSSGDSQQNVTYRRTIDPLAVVYAAMLTECIHDDFEPSLHGDLLEATFGGFEEAEDEQAKAKTLSTYTGAGILGLSAAGKLANLPEDPEAVPIGRVIVGKDGPIFLDDAAAPELRDAQKQAQLAGYQLAANPPAPEPTPPPGTPPGPGKPLTAPGTPGEKPPKSPVTKTANTAHNNQQRVVAAPAEANTGMMLAFMLDPKTANMLALPGGEPASNLHITLAYLGDMEEESENDLLRPHTSPFKIRAAIASIASEAMPLSGQVGGVGRFRPAEADETPVIALVDVPGLVELRTKLVEAIQAVGYFVANNHGFTPHITLDYIDPEAPMSIDDVPPLPLALDTVCLVIGESRFAFRLGEEQYPQYWEQKVATTVNQHRAIATSTDRELSAEFRRWRQRALEDIKQGKSQRSFTTTIIPEPLQRMISGVLAHATSIEDVKIIFERAKTVSDPFDTGAWQQTDPEILQQVAKLQAQGVTRLTGVAAPGACDECLRNDKVTVALGQPFPTGALLPDQQHPHCACSYTVTKQPMTEGAA